MMPSNMLARFAARLDDARFAALLVAVASVVVYANSVANWFAYDDYWIIFMNERLHQLDDLGRIVGTPYWPNFGEKLGLYRPLTVLFFAVQWVLTDGGAWLFHAINVAMHALVSVLVLLMLRHFASARAAFAGALLFAVHPLHTEAVANIVGQAELWAGISVVGASVVFLQRPGDEELTLARILAIAALYAIGLFAKEHSIVLPGILVALEVARRPMPLRAYVARHARSALAALALLAAVAGTYLTIRYSVLGSITGQDAGPQYPFLREEYRVFSALRAWPEYMRLLFFPTDLTADYSPGVIMPVEGTVTPMMLLGALILGALITLALSTFWRPRIGLPAAWFFICILPVSNLLFPIGVLLAERILYLPSVALGFLVAFVWDWAAARDAERLPAADPAPRSRSRMAAAAVVVGVIAVWFGALTWVRNPDWKTSQTIVGAVIRDHPESYRAQWNAGALAMTDGDTARGVAHWELAIRMWDRDSNMLTNLATYYLGAHRYGRARELLLPAHRMNPDLHRTLSGLAVAELGVGNTAEAVRLAEQGIRDFDTDGHFFDIRARAQRAAGQPLEAAASWRVAIRLGADSWLQWAQLAGALGEADSTAAAVAALDSAIARRRTAGDTATVSRLERARAGLLD